MRFIKFLVVILLLAAVGSVGAQDFGALYTTETVHCPDAIVNGPALTATGTEVEGETYSCGVVVVPENYDAPEGRIIELFYVKLHSSSESPAPDPLVYLAGGPGGSASHEIANFVVLYLNMLPIREQRDIIVYDQRGTGYSNYLGCAQFESTLGILLERNTNPDISATMASLQSDAMSDFALKGSLCGAMLTQLAGVDLAQYNSAVSAQDIAHVADALGYTGTYNLYGTSYGTRLAQYALRATPDRIRSVVMDGVSGVSVHNVTITFAKRFEVYLALFAQCEADEACNAAYPNLTQRFGTLLEELEASPLVFDPPLVVNPALVYPGGLPATVSQIDPAFFVTLAEMNNGTAGGGLAKWVPRMVMAAEARDADYFQSFLGVAQPPPEVQQVAGPANSDNVASFQAAQPLFQVPFNYVLNLAQIAASAAGSGLDIQWLSIVLGDFSARLNAGEDQASLMEDILYLSVLPNTGTTAQNLIDFANTHLSASAAEAANAVVGHMTRAEVRSTLWQISGVATNLSASPTSLAMAPGMQNAFNCADEVNFATLEQSQAYLDASPYPQLITVPMSFNEAAIAVCQSFPRPLDESVMEPVVSDTPALLYLEQLDIQTPVTWGRGVAETLSNSFTVEWRNMGHIAATHDDKGCAGTIAAAFLADPATQPDISCSQTDDYRLIFVLPQ
jgi:pimeloyl-ACP methyl ester carboxylesterase